MNGKKIEFHITFVKGVINVVETHWKPARQFKSFYENFICFRASTYVQAKQCVLLSSGNVSLCKIRVFEFKANNDTLAHAEHWSRKILVLLFCSCLPLRSINVSIVLSILLSFRQSVLPSKIMSAGMVSSVSSIIDYNRWLNGSVATIDNWLFFG